MAPEEEVCIVVSSDWSNHLRAITLRPRGQKTQPILSAEEDGWWLPPPCFSFSSDHCVGRSINSPVWHPVNSLLSSKSETSLPTGKQPPYALRITMKHKVFSCKKLSIVLKIVIKSHAQEKVKL